MLWVPYVSNAGSAIVYDNVCPVPLAFLGSDSIGCCRDDVPFNSFAQVSPRWPCRLYHVISAFAQTRLAFSSRIACRTCTPTTCRAVPCRVLVGVREKVRILLRESQKDVSPTFSKRMQGIMPRTSDRADRVKRCGKRSQTIWYSFA